MNTQTAVSGVLPLDLDTKVDHGARTRLLLASSVGSIVEWYDFAVFAVCAAMVFNTAFFPAADPFAGLLAALMAQAVGFVARPLGGWFFGMLGDKIGRKRSLVASLLLMGVATIAMGLVPTYAQVGVAAPILLVILRLLQGFAVGGESTGALVIVAESMPARQRGFWTGFPMIGGPAGNVLATTVIGAAIAAFGQTAFVDWAWRLPFLASAVLIVFGFWMRRRIEESPAFVEAREQHDEVPRAPLREALREHPASMARVLFIKSGESTLFYLFSTFFIVLATLFLRAPREAALTALFWGSIAQVAAILGAGALSDIVGRKPVTVLGLLGSVAAAFHLFTLESGASEAVLTAATMLTLTCHGVVVGGMSAHFTELFPARIRYTAMSTAYSVAAVLGGALAPIVGTGLLELVQAPIAVAVYASAMAVPALWAIATSRETRGSNLIQ
ncbi:major facilitator superfamily MFS_1 [Methylorubrum populi BJ001]|jgi:MFS family permease|uniref:Major facilitator superfamily MFS_1 n=1 Tax=Methylorubrum populi (strain ATCC BAA-705 / NCIMB 13946 / BJ001) TaxID=441620 RepID=B1ZAY1_METPB|nr:MFS transporter [Methylorubrum populi]ACB79219.1 major facilitator superfamily MFS_1 [Methylorubrum populi BJ001]OAH27532.1 MFS transporter permease [Methylorubrum populi]PZP68102.1 MAG: MFS transporter [Methylorubrum populi]